MARLFVDGLQEDGLGLGRKREALQDDAVQVEQVAVHRLERKVGYGCLANEINWLSLKSFREQLPPSHFRVSLSTKTGRRQLNTEN